MGRSGSGSFPSFFAVFFAVLLAAGGGAYWLFSKAPARLSPADEGYYRAVYVLQRMGGPASAEEEDIPPAIPYADATESLLHHPDKILVLRGLADDLALFGRDKRKGALFEAYARLGLGEQGRAAALLTRYVADAPYAFEHYLLLARTLYELEDDGALLLICREWDERESVCLDGRERMAVAALFNLKRYEQAKAYALRHEDCLRWEAFVYAARAALARGGEEEADALLGGALRRFPADGPAVLRLWELLRERERL